MKSLHVFETKNCVTHVGVYTYEYWTLAIVSLHEYIIIIYYKSSGCIFSETKISNEMPRKRVTKMCNGNSQKMCNENS